ncbi:MAG: DUF1413 domain-containing protein [Abditibacteriota bacterium]|nr:DUF1413 domain-containing protein [Abditibacteriota bacterium]
MDPKTIAKIAISEAMNKPKDSAFTVSALFNASLWDEIKALKLAQEVEEEFENLRDKSDLDLITLSESLKIYTKLSLRSNNNIVKTISSGKSKRKLTLLEIAVRLACLLPFNTMFRIEELFSREALKRIKKYGLYSGLTEEFYDYVKAKKEAALEIYNDITPKLAIYKRNDVVLPPADEEYIREIMDSFNALFPEEYPLDKCDIFGVLIKNTIDNHNKKPRTLLQIAIALANLLPAGKGIKFNIRKLFSKKAWDRIVGAEEDQKLFKDFYNYIKEGKSKSIEIVEDNGPVEETLYERNSVKLPPADLDYILGILRAFNIIFSGIDINDEDYDEMEYDDEGGSFDNIEGLDKEFGDDDIIITEDHWLSSHSVKPLNLEDFVGKIVWNSIKNLMYPKLDSLLDIALALASLLPSGMKIKFSVKDLFGRAAWERIVKEEKHLKLEKDFYNYIKAGKSKTVEFFDDFGPHDSIYLRNKYVLPTATPDYILHILEAFNELFPDTSIDNLFSGMVREFMYDLVKEAQSLWAKRRNNW